MWSYHCCAITCRIRLSVAVVTLFAQAVAVAVTLAVAVYQALTMGSTLTAVAVYRGEPDERARQQKTENDSDDLNLLHLVCKLMIHFDIFD